METVCIIPARGGSKGIPKKNIMDFCGKPLIAWSIEQAFAAGVTEVYVSSDDPEIIHVASRCGAYGIYRPAELSGDKATSESAILHAIETIAAFREEPEIVVFLQATSPIRDAESIRGMVDAVAYGGFGSCFSTVEMNDYLLWEGGLPINYDFNNRGTREGRRPVSLETGSIYVFRTDEFKKANNRICGVVSSHPCHRYTQYELDEPDDIPVVEFFFKQFTQTN